MANTDLERCKKALRSILLANKTGIPARQFFKEYSNLYEEEIPYRKFNFPTLEKFLMSIPDVCTITTRRGEVVVEGVASQGTSHIEKLVQRTGWKKGGGGGYSRPPPPPPSHFKRTGGCGGMTHHPALGRGQFFPRRSAPPPQQPPMRPSPNKVSKPDSKSNSPPKNLKGGVDRFLSNGMLNDPMVKLSAQGKSSQNGLGNVLNGSAKSRTIPSISKPTARDWDLQITAVEASNEVWVCLYSSKEVRRKLQAELLLQQHSAGSYGGGVMPPGSYFSAEVVPGQCWRVKVSKVDRIHHTAHCFLIDSGKQMDIPWTSLVPLQQEFWSTEAQAFRIQLQGFTLFHNVNVLGYVREKLEDKRVYGREVGGSNTLDIPLVSIMEADPEGDLMFIDNLIQDMKQINQGNTAVVNGGIVQERAGIINNNSQDKVDREALKHPELPDLDDFYDCVVSHVVTPGEVWLQSHHSLQIYRTLHQQLREFYSASKGMEVKDPEPGLMVAVRIGVDWFRARIIMKMKSMADSKAEDFLVKLVDTGHVECVPLTSIKVMEKDFLSLPRQAIKVRLEGIKKAGEEAKIWLREFCRGKSLVGYVKARQEDKLGMVLYDTTMEDKDININEEIVSLGLAFKKDL